MSLVVDYGLDTPARSLPILALNLEDQNGNKKMRILHLQKIIRYFEFLRQKSEIEFSNLHLGAVSYELQENLEELEDYRFIDRTNQNTLQLSELGENAAKELKEKLTQDELQKLSFAKKQLNDLPDDELMFFMYMLLPETRKNSTEFDRLTKKKVPLTKSLFVKGRIGALAASKWLEISETKFMSLISRSD